jgi:hypothetical protein
MIEDGVNVVVPALDDSWWILWHVGGGIVLPSQTRQFSKVQFPIGFGFWIFHSPKVPPNCPKFVQSPIFYLVNYYTVEIGKPKNLPIAPNSPNSPKSLSISNPVGKVQFPKSKIIQPERYSARLANYYYLDNKMTYLNLSTVESFKINNSNSANYWIG